MAATTEKQLVGVYTLGESETYINDVEYGITTVKPVVEVYANLDISKDFASNAEFNIYLDAATTANYEAKVELYNSPIVLKVSDYDTGETLLYKSFSANYQTSYFSGTKKILISRFSGICNNIIHHLDGTKKLRIETDCILTITNYRDSNHYSSTQNYELVSSYVIDLPTISRSTEILTATNFNDEENPVITYSLPYQPNTEHSKVTALEAALSFDGSTADIAYRSISKDAVSYTFNLTTAERNVLRNKCANCATAPIYYLLRTTCTNTATGETAAFIASTEKILSIVSAMPSIAPTVEDVNSVTLALTGNKNTIVKYFSNAQYEINATASKGASINYQQVTAGSKSSTAESGILYNVDSNKFIFTCSDSRDNIASLTLEKGLVNYVKLTCNLNITAPDTSGNLSFTMSGNYYNGSFGAANNTLALKYRYKVNSGDYGEWVTVTPTLKNNTYSTNTITLTGLDYLNTYTFQAQAVDKLETVTSREYIAKTAPVFDWSNSDFNFNVPVTYSENGNEYSISEAAKKLSGVDISNDMLLKMSGLVNALTSRQNCAVEVYNGANYSEVFVSMQLIGNALTGYVDAKRNSNAGTGDIGNEIVCSVEFDIAKKVTGFNSCGFPSATIGSLASFAIEDCQIYKNDGSVSEDMVGKGSFNIYLTATDISNNRYNGFFTMPCMLDLSKF